MPCHFGQTAVQKCIEEQPVTMTLLDLAESNSSRNFGFTTSLRAISTCYSWIVMPASAGQDKMKDLIATESGDMTSACHNLKSYKVDISGKTV